MFRKESGLAMPQHLEDSGSLDPVEMQLAVAVQQAQLGMVDEITEKALPDLASTRPALFNIMKVHAIGSRVDQLMSISPLVQVSPEARGKIKTEVSRLMNDASEIINSWLENGEPEENIQIPFLFGRDEAQSFDAAVNMGLVDLINEVNFPFLAAIHEDDVIRFKLLSINTALNNWENIESISEEEPGFKTTSKEGSNLNEFANKKMAELQEMKEKLLVKKESSE